MIAYEYMSVLVHLEIERLNRPDDALNVYGREGWRVVDAHRSDRASMTYLLERSIRPVASD